MENRGDWETIGLTEMMNEVGKAGKAGKYAFIHDKQGNVPMFFQYKGVLCDFQREVMKVRINQGQPAEACEVLRKAVVNAMRSGDTLCINLSKLTPDFSGEFSTDVLPMSQFLNREEWRKADNYMRIVKDDEKYMIGGLNEGHYIMQDEFQVVVVTQTEKEEDLNKIIGSLPNFDQFTKLVVE